MEGRPSKKKEGPPKKIMWRFSINTISQLHFWVWKFGVVLNFFLSEAATAWLRKRTRGKFFFISEIFFYSLAEEIFVGLSAGISLYRDCFGSCCWHPLSRDCLSSAPALGSPNRALLLLPTLHISRPTWLGTAAVHSCLGWGWYSQQQPC